MSTKSEASIAYYTIICVAVLYILDSDYCYLLLINSSWAVSYREDCMVAHVYYSIINNIGLFLVY